MGKKKKRARSRSRSSSGSETSRISSSRPKKSKKKHKRERSRSRSGDRRRERSRSRSVDRRRQEVRSRRSRSRSSDKYHDSRTRSHSRSPSYRSLRRSRSRSRTPSDRRRSYSRSRRQRSRSYSRERDKRSRSRSTGKSNSKRSSPDRRRERSRSRGSPSRSRGSPANVALKGLSLLEQDVMESLTPAEQAENRMRLALKAAALADEQLRLRNVQEEGNSNSSLTVLDRQDFASSVAAIESDSFVTSTFSSSASRVKVKEDPTEHRLSHDDAIFGSLSVTGFQLKPDLDSRPIDMDPDSIMHPSLYYDPEEKMDRWIQKVTQMRRRLEGEAM